VSATDWCVVFAVSAVIATIAYLVGFAVGFHQKREKVLQALETDVDEQGRLIYRVGNPATADTCGPEFRP
jgi:hypothetical protein